MTNKTKTEKDAEQSYYHYKITKKLPDKKLNLLLKGR